MSTPTQTQIKERRSSPRTKIAQVLQIRPTDPRLPIEVSTTINVSRQGLYFSTTKPNYFASMYVLVIRNFRPGDPMNREERAEVVRVERMENGAFGVALRIFRPDSHTLW